VTATDQTTTPLDLAPIRERLARYEAMGDKLNDGKLPDLSRSATATAIGLAASFVAAYVPDLLAEIERLRNAVGDSLPIPTVPPGLDARPVVRFTVHCSHCGKPAPGYDSDGPCLWADEDLPKLGAYHLNDCDWHTNDRLADPDFEGRALVCPECWAVAWCETCTEEIHAWQPFESERAGVNWHKACGRPGSELPSRDAYREVSQ
jgi:hypothetical protein